VPAVPLRDAASEPEPLPPSPVRLAIPEPQETAQRLFALLTWDRIQSVSQRLALPPPSDAFRLRVVPPWQAPDGPLPAREEARAGQATERPPGARVGQVTGPSLVPALAPTAIYFGVRVPAQRVVYVIDASLSMLGDPFERARGELVDSVARLDPGQHFGVVFFAEREAAAFPAGDELIPATDEQRAALSRWLAQQRPRGGTQAEAALARAFAWKPDVVFLLSDGSLPQRTVSQTRPPPGAKTVVHVIGYLSRSGEYTLRRLAEAHHGNYHFVPR
jgi:hypothetical protein